MDPAEIHLFLSETLSGRYRPHTHLGSGAFSGTFQAADANVDADVAVKVLKLHQCTRADAVDEFRGEVALLRRLRDCDRVVDIHDSGQHTVHLNHRPSGGTIPVTTEFAVLELAAGALADLLLLGRSFGWSDRLRLYRDVVKGVHQMHLRRIVHRDVKADNALVFERPEIAKVADLGRSHDTNEPPRFVVEAYLHGRGDPHFAPLEFLWLQGTEDPDDQARADLYLLGSLLFEVATGVSFTALIASDPRSVMATNAALPEADRKRDWCANVPWLREVARPARETFAGEVPSNIRPQAVALLEQLTDPDPLRRLPTFHGGRRRVTPWDLQWLLERIDGMRRAIDPRLRREYLAGRPSRRRHSRPRTSKR
jgi:eukaryotic-like serine/threonine-protein kinase